MDEQKQEEVAQLSDQPVADPAAEVTPDAAPGETPAEVADPIVEKTPEVLFQEGFTQLVESTGMTLQATLSLFKQDNGTFSIKCENIIVPKQ